MEGRRGENLEVVLKGYNSFDDYVTTTYRFTCTNVSIIIIIIMEPLMIGGFELLKIGY